MNIAIILAGGSGQRMHAKDIPKQFLKMHKKPILVYTLEVFEECSEIDHIIVVCKEGWIEYLKDLLDKYHILKSNSIVYGGETGQLSIYNGLLKAEEISKTSDGHESIVIIHDGVRPLINSELIRQNILDVKRFGSAITIGDVTETIIVTDGDSIENIPNRNMAKFAKAPQSFWLNDIINVHRKAMLDNTIDSIDSCTLMNWYGYKMHLLDGPKENIKITTPEDYYVLRALLDAQENRQLY